MKLLILSTRKEHELFLKPRFVSWWRWHKSSIYCVIDLLKNYTKSTWWKAWSCKKNHCRFSYFPFRSLNHEVEWDLLHFPVVRLQVNPWQHDLAKVPVQREPAFAQLNRNLNATIKRLWNKSYETINLPFATFCLISVIVSYSQSEVHQNNQNENSSQ